MTVNNGTSPYDYIWSTGETTSSISGLAAGDYSFTVTDATQIAVSNTVSVTQPNQLTAWNWITPTNCLQNTLGSVTITSTGGTAPYNISPSTTTGLVAGNYQYTVTDANNCQATTNAYIYNSYSNVTLTSQAEVNAFVANHGSCTT